MSASSQSPLGALDLLIALQRLVSRHPRLVGGVLASLIAEGRAYGATPAGRATRESLAASASLRRGRLLWDSLALGSLARASNAAPATAWLEGLLALAGSETMEVLLSNAVLRRPGEGR